MRCSKKMLFRMICSIYSLILLRTMKVMVGLSVCILYVPKCSILTEYEASRMAKVKLIRLDKQWKKIEDLQVNIQEPVKYFEDFEDKFMKPGRKASSRLDTTTAQNDQPTYKSRKAYYKYLEVGDKGLSLTGKEVSISFWFYYTGKSAINKLLETNATS